jgi:hypothetical protein
MLESMEIPKQTRHRKLKCATGAWHILTSFHDKILKKLGIEEISLTIIKATVYDNRVAKILSRENKPFSLVRNKTRVAARFPFINVVL